MSIVIGTEVIIRTFQEWEQILNVSGFHDFKLKAYYDDIFERSYSFSETTKIMFKMLYHMTRNKEVRKKISPTLKFARTFQKALKGG